MGVNEPRKGFEASAQHETLNAQLSRLLGEFVGMRQEREDGSAFGAHLAVFFKGRAADRWRARSFDFAQDDGQKEAGRTKHAILPNEPTVFWRNF